MPWLPSGIVRRCVAAHLNAAFRLPGNPPEAAAATRNKLAARKAFQAAGLPSPDFQAVSLHRGSRCDRAGHVVSGGDQAARAVGQPRRHARRRRAARSSTPSSGCGALLQSPDVRIEHDEAHDRALIETFVPGAEYAVEGLLTSGTFTPLAIFDKPDPLDGPFFEETIYVTPSRQSDAQQQRIIDGSRGRGAGARAVSRPVHAECRVNDRGVYVLEVAARPIGGLCSKALRFATPDADGTARVSLEEVLLRHALGEDGLRLSTRGGCVGRDDDADSEARGVSGSAGRGGGAGHRRYR